MARIKLPRKRDYATLRKWLLEYRHLSTEDLARFVGISIAKIREWKVYCDVVDLKEGELLKVWVNYKNYSEAEACVVLGVTRTAFKTALDRHNITRYKKKPRSRPKTPISVPRNREDFAKLLDKYGTREISRLSGLSRNRIIALRKKFGLTNVIERNEFDPECDSRKWLVEHYVNKKLSLRKCAKLAGVSFVTIREWLIKHGIVPRPHKHATLQAGIP